MSKELIEKLRAFAPHASPNAADLMHEAVEYLEAKAAPVGERDHDTKGSRKALGAMNAKLKAKVGRLERELAAHQRQQAREVVMPTLVVKESGEWGDAYERGFKAALREFARLNKGGSHE